jgi:ubiquinone/menaquinone biosynthesis C-methylase UbiE
MSQTVETPPVEEGREAWQRAAIRTSGRSAPAEYLPFGNVESRNGLQALVEIPLMLRALRLPHRARVLEIGCGRGVALPVLDDRLEPVELVGLDVDAALLDEARERVRNSCTEATLVEGDVRDLPFEAGRFDLVIDFGTCYHVSDTMDGRRAALREVSRVLRTGGLFVHETRVAQRLAHPLRSFGRRLPWWAVPSLVRDRSATLWGVRRKIGG